MAYKPLTPRQLEVLKWIADGSPEGVMTDETHKHSAAALKNRRLAKVSKRDGWHATITPDGLYYIEHGRYPGQTAVSAVTRTRAKRSTPATPAKSVPVPPVVEDPSPAQASIDDGPQAEQEAVEPRNVPIPDQLRRPHEVVVQLRDDKSHFAIMGPARRRALLIAQGLISACESEGWIVRPIGSQVSGYGRKVWDSKDHFVVDTGECKVSVRFVQEQDRTDHVPTPHELAEKKRYQWTRIPKYDYEPSERIRIEIDRGSRRKYGDGKKAALPSKLPQILDVIQACHETAIAQRLDHERREIEREEQWRVAMARAKLLLRESNRANVLVQQARDWCAAGDLREYIGAMEASAGRLVDDEERQAAEEWIGWARAHCERIDPLTGRLAMPEDPKPEPKALEPFLGGWSPYGPRGW